MSVSDNFVFARFPFFFLNEIAGSDQRDYRLVNNNHYNSGDDAWSMFFCHGCV